MYSGFIAALVISIILTVIALALGRRGPWGTAWTFFLFLFLSLWAISIYIRSIGPVYFGVPWVPLVSAGILLSFLLVAAIPTTSSRKNKTLRQTDTGQQSELQDQSDPTNTGAGRFFWILILLIIAAIIIGMTSPQPAL